MSSGLPDQEKFEDFVDSSFVYNKAERRLPMYFTYTT